jgi:hypothetical protein
MSASLDESTVEVSRKKDGRLRWLLVEEEQGGLGWKSESPESESVDARKEALRSRPMK